MKYRISISFLFLIIPLVHFAQLSLTVEICGLRNNSGQIHFELNNEREEQVSGVTKNISHNRCIIVIENLKPGKYAFKFFHDENKNERLDTNWLGIPKEGFGFSNNPRLTFGPPSFSPLSYHKWTGSSEGAIVGWEFKKEMPVINKIQIADRSVLTPLPSVYQAGQWAYSPAGVPMSILTGKLAAKRVA